ncbi:MAG: prepilin-type N-terminal cleavage/methylation domain-containing protein [Candidatus Anammoxibacter sp.]
MKRSKDNKGFTLIEIIVVLGVIAILAAVLTPMLISYLKDARARKAESDVKVIAGAIQAFDRDLGAWPIWVAGASTNPMDDTFDVLSSEAGDEISFAQVLDSNLDSSGQGDADDDLLSLWTTTGLDSFDNQLMANSPAGVAANGYPFTGKRKWVGPYLSTIGEDPWGNKYYCNIKYLQPEFQVPGNESAVFVLSAGPNEIIDTSFTQAITVKTRDMAGGDDIIFRLK